MVALTLDLFQDRENSEALTSPTASAKVRLGDSKEPFQLLQRGRALSPRAAFFPQAQPR